MDQYLGEIRMFAGNFVPFGWARCDGQLLPISQNTALFSLLGTNYGGNGMTTFALPDLRDATPVHMGQAPGLSEYHLGQRGGAESVTLTEADLPVHEHEMTAVPAGTLGTTGNPSAATWARSRQGRAVERLYTTGAATTTMSPGAMSATGGDQPHPNRPPSLGVTFMIALQGIFPPRQ